MVQEYPPSRFGSASSHDDESKARRASGEPHGFTKQSLVVVAALSFLLLCLVLLLGYALLGGSSDAMCGQNLPSVKPARAILGETFRLHGGGFQDGCNDSNLPFQKYSARQDIRIEMRQGGSSWTLASGLAAGGPPDYVLDVKLKVPSKAKPGGAVVVIPDQNSAGPMKIPFRVLGGGPG